MKEDENKLSLVTSVDEYLKEVFDLEDILLEKFPYQKSTMLFRGQGNKKYELMPAIGRNRRFDVDVTIMNQERNLIELSKHRLPDVFNRMLEPIELLALLQHYGIPTRLLDVTSNALAALFFACEIENEFDGEVIVFVNNDMDFATYPIVNAIADSYRFLRGTLNIVDKFYEKVVEQPYFLEQKNIIKTPEESIGWIKEVCNTPIFINAPIHASRQ